MRGQGNIRLAASPGGTYKAEGQDVWRIGGNTKDPFSTKIAGRCRKVSVLQEGPKRNKAYAASLQKLAEHCDFGDTLSDASRDRLVCGMRMGRCKSDS